MQACFIFHVQRRAAQLLCMDYACEQYQRRAKLLTHALTACGVQFSQASKAEIPISELEQPQVIAVCGQLAALQYQLSLTGEDPLSLTDARALFNSCVVDAMLSILSRLRWSQFCRQTDALAVLERGFRLAGIGLTCVQELLHACHRVVPPHDADVARTETFGRYYYLHLLVREVCVYLALASEEGLKSKLGQAG